MRIDLVIEPPLHRFKYAEPLRWTKRWKMDGSIIEERSYLNSGEDIKQTDNVYKWLDKIRFRYVPAVKGGDYFSSLMGELHDVLNNAHSATLSAQGQRFIRGIQKITENITAELSRQINLPSAIQVPSDFKILFSNLDFGSIVNNNIYHLKQRGDGIKARHIPIILKSMAEQEKNIAIPGYVKPDTIWGFEEPENNLELKFAFELAKNFLEYSKDLQIFITTHSPAFYALDEVNEDVVTFFVNQDSEKCTYIRKTSFEDTDTIHEAMGLLPLISPYIQQIYEKQQYIENLKSEIDNLPTKIKCIVLTEDENPEHLVTYLKLNKFCIEETEVIPYYGADNINASIILGKYLKTKLPKATIIIHRDQDYLTPDQINDFRSKIEKQDFHFFTTKGVDVENEYLIAEHINYLYPEISISDAKLILENSTKATIEDSIKRLVNHTFLTQKINNSDAYGEMEKIKQLYNSDPERYRYGKKFLGHTKSQVQKIVKRNTNLYQYSPYIKNTQLTSISDSIWDTDEKIGT
nr:hypothetical protein [uncultured Pseudomonas sp.]